MLKIKCMGLNELTYASYFASFFLPQSPPTAKAGTSILITGVIFIAKYPLPSLPPGGKELASD
jgi:hypothetical protein